MSEVRIFWVGAEGRTYLIDRQRVRVEPEEVRRLDIPIERRVLEVTNP